MASKKRSRKRSSKRAAAAPVAETGNRALEWASDHRYGLAAGAAGVAALVYLWPREAQAAQLPAPAPALPTYTPEQVAQQQTERQHDLGMKIGLGAFALLAVGTIILVTK